MSVRTQAVRPAPTRLIHAPGPVGLALGSRNAYRRQACRYRVAPTPTKGRGGRTRCHGDRRDGCGPGHWRVAAKQAGSRRPRRPSTVTTDGRVTIVELSDQGQALLPRLKAAWQQLAEHTVAGLTSTPLDQLADALADVAASLTTFQHATSEPAPPRATSCRPRFGSASRISYGPLRGAA